MGIYKQLDEASSEQLVQWWNADVPDWADSRESFLEEIAYALSELGEQGVAFLKRYARDSDPEKRWNAVYFLADKRFVDEEILGYLKEAFHSPDLGLKTAALWGYIYIGQFPLERVEVEALVNGNEERLSALAMVYLSYAHPPEAIAILRSALSSPHPRHREYACDEIGDRDITELQPLLRDLLSDPDEDVRQAAQANLRE